MTAADRVAEIKARERLELIDVLAAGDGQNWYDFWENAEQRRIGEVMYGAQADAILASSWLADRLADAERRAAAAEAERDNLRAKVAAVEALIPMNGSVYVVTTDQLREALGTTASDYLMIPRAALAAPDQPGEDA